MTKLKLAYYYTDNSFEQLEEGLESEERGFIYTRKTQLRNWDIEKFGHIPNIQVMREETDDRDSYYYKTLKFENYLNDLLDITCIDDELFPFMYTDEPLPMKPIIETIQDMIDKHQLPYELIYYPDWNDPEIEEHTPFKNEHLQ